MSAKRIERTESTKSFEFQDDVFYIRERYKVGRFLKKLNDDPIGALELVLVEESYEKFLDLEITMDELNEFLESLAKNISGSSLGN